jgi:LacI family transcriptional regulator
MAERSPTLHDIARLTGLSTMTVSRALRGAPKVASATRQKVLSTAEQLGYKPDPELARLMEAVRGRRNRGVRATIAVIREYVPQDGLLGPSYQYVPVESIRLRARRYGYEVEEFFLGRDGLTPVRLQEVLRARGTEAVIVSPQSMQLPCARIDYTPFAAVTFGNAMQTPALHMCAGNMTVGIQTAAERLSARGYRRIGVAVTRWIVTRSQFGYSGGLFHWQHGHPTKNRVPLLLFPSNTISEGREAFKQWMRKYQPDAVITFDTHVPGWLQSLGYRIPDDIGFVVHDWTPRMSGFAGIHQRRDQLAAAAVDLVVAQLSLRERGVPEVPRHLMIPPEWVDGPSVRGGS